ncbi:MAG: BtaA family protein [Planctomycetaceae bacterium]|nr:BtaA family protein [Planctomycetaceae bacterium]
MPLGRLSRAAFNLVHGRNLVYNQCWEDPRLDRQALQLSSSDNLVVITSAGCNALDYVLAGTGHVYAVDMNFRQNAVLELKKSGIRNLDYPTFFKLFGEGNLPEWKEVYPSKLRNDLPPDAQKFWDRYGKFFTGTRSRPSYYFRGTSGLFAWIVNGYINRIARIRGPIDELLEAKTVEEQQEVFQRHDLKKKLFRPLLRWLLGRDATMALLGVPRSQRQQLDRDYPGGIAQFIEDRVETVFAKLPLHDNYFWRVYLTGKYTPTCCPEYLKEHNFEELKAGAIDRVTTHTDSLLGFLEKHDGQISRYVLLDHMDWLYANYKEILTTEWQAIVDKAAPGTKIIWRSASLDVDFIDPIEVERDGQKYKLGDLLTYDREMAERLHPIDRVNTYGSFYITDLADRAPAAQ